jgi:hypothetical protein
MPTYSWTLGQPGGVATRAGRGGTYAFTPAFDPATRDHLMLGSQWRPGDPMAEVVLLTLATPKRSYRPDPTLGPDYDVLRKQAPGLRAAWKAEVEGALARYVAAGQLVLAPVQVDPPRGGRLVYLVEFVDPRASTRDPTRLPLVAPL